jgi:hypothetical protein
MALGNIVDGARTMWAKFFPAASGRLAGEQGDRLASDDALKRLYATMWVDFERRAMIRQIREMDQRDGRIKQIHNRLARDCIRGGLVLQLIEKSSSETLKREWQAISGRLQLDHAAKLKSDARGLVVEGNLPLQLVFNDAMELVAGIRMPSDTIVAITDMGGRFKDAMNAYEQRDVMSSRTIGKWAAWQMALGRLDPDNFDDLGSMGRPFLDACAQTWQKLVMTEEDLVIRRRMRAPLRLAHVLEGAQPDDIDKYRKDHESRAGLRSRRLLLEQERRRDTDSGRREPRSDQGRRAPAGHDVRRQPGAEGTLRLHGQHEPRHPRGPEARLLRRGRRLQDVGAACYETAFRIHLLFKGIDPGARASSRCVMRNVAPTRRTRWRISRSSTSPRACPTTSCTARWDSIPTTCARNASSRPSATTRIPRTSRILRPPLATW